jgi:hypothetical protein
MQGSAASARAMLLPSRSLTYDSGLGSAATREPLLSNL